MYEQSYLNKRQGHKKQITTPELSTIHWSSPFAQTFLVHSLQELGQERSEIQQIMRLYSFIMPRNKLIAKQRAKDRRCQAYHVSKSCRANKCDFCTRGGGFIFLIYNASSTGKRKQVPAVASIVKHSSQKP